MSENQSDIWKQKIVAINKSLPHGSNIRTKILHKNASSPNWQAALSRICPAYFSLNSSYETGSSNLKKWIEQSLLCLDNYLEVLKHPEAKVFSHQSDLISSVLPEFFFFLFNKFVVPIFSGLKVGSQEQIIIECAFLPHVGKEVVFKWKRVDVAILKPCKLSVENKVVEEFNIPVVALEVKTNLDKNMISGIEHSVESLKKTFPLCKYYVISEFADFAIEKQNYAATFIDEIFVLRKQKRSSVRKTAISNVVDKDLCFSLTKEIIKHLKRVNELGVDLKGRMQEGKLIQRK